MLLPYTDMLNWSEAADIALAHVDQSAEEQEQLAKVLEVWNEQHYAEFKKDNNVEEAFKTDDAVESGTVPQEKAQFETQLKKNSKWSKSFKNKLLRNVKKKKK